MTSVSAGHIILIPTQPVGSGRPQRGSNPGPPDQESRALPTELPHPPPDLQKPPLNPAVKALLNTELCASLAVRGNSFKRSVFLCLEDKTVGRKRRREGV